jgi:3-oxoacyl-[acyl-carrier protein] reductase
LAASGASTIVRAMPRARCAVLLCGSARAPLAAIARQLAGAGVPVLIQAAEANLREARRLCRILAHGGAAAQVVDGALADEAGVHAFVTEAWTRARAIQSVVICPEIPAVSVRAAGLDEWDASLAVGLRAPFFLAQHVARRLRRAGGGQLVFAIGGTDRGAPGAVVHAGLLCMVEGLAKALPSGVTIAAVVGAGRMPARAAAQQLARGVRDLVVDPPRASGTILTLGTPTTRG